MNLPLLCHLIQVVGIIYTGDMSIPLLEVADFVLSIKK